MRRRDSLAEDDRRLRVVRRYLHAAEVAKYEIDVDAPAETFVERFRAIDVGDCKHHDFELHVWLCFCWFSHFHFHRNDLNAARRSCVMYCGCSQAAKCPPLSCLV